MITKIADYDGFNHIRRTISSQNFCRKQEQLFEDEKMNSYYQEAEKIYEKARNINKQLIEIQTSINNLTKSHKTTPNILDNKIQELDQEKSKLIALRETLIEKLNKLSSQSGIKFSTNIYKLLPLDYM
jgi:hypothetical protein